MSIVLKRVDSQANSSPGNGDPPRYVRVACPNCASIITVDSSTAGTPVNCFECHEFLLVPKGRYGTGSVIADFVLIKHLYTSISGDIYLANQRSMDRVCILKLLSALPAFDKTSAEAFLKQARVGTRLNHRNIVQVYAIGQEDELLHCATEHTDAELLQRQLARKWRLPPVLALDICRQVAAALGHAWKQERLAHGMLSPESILVSTDAPAKVDDLGLYRAELGRGNAGDVLPYHLCRAPELIGGGKPDQRSDMYSLGCVLYQILTGEPVLGGQTVEEANRRHLQETPIPICERVPELHPRMGWLLDKLLAKSPNERHPDWGTVVSSMELLYALALDALAPAEKTTMLASGNTRPPFSDETILPGTDTTPPPPAPDAKPQRTSGGRRIGTMLLWLVVATALALGTAFVLDRPATIDWLQRLPMPGAKTAPSVAVSLPAAETRPVPAPPAEEPGTPPESVAATDDGAKPPLAQAVRIVALLPDPVGYDPGNETVRLANTTSDRSIDLSSLSLLDDDGRTQALSGTLEPAREIVITLPRHGIELSNLGKKLMLIAADGRVIDRVAYAAEDVAEGVEIWFDPGDPGKPRPANGARN